MVQKRGRRARRRRERRALGVGREFRGDDAAAAAAFRRDAAARRRPRRRFDDRFFFCLDDNDRGRLLRLDGYSSRPDGYSLRLDGDGLRLDGDGLRLDGYGAFGREAFFDLRGNRLLGRDAAAGAVVGAGSRPRRGVSRGYSAEARRVPRG